MELFLFLLFAAASVWLGWHTYSQENPPEHNRHPAGEERVAASAGTEESADDAGPEEADPEALTAGEDGTGEDPEKEESGEASGEKNSGAEAPGEKEEDPGSGPEEENAGPAPEDASASEAAEDLTEAPSPEQADGGTESRENAGAEAGSENPENETDDPARTEENGAGDETGAEAVSLVHDWRNRPAYLADDGRKEPVFPDLRCYRVLPGMEIPEEFRLRALELNLQGILQTLADRADGDWSIWFRNLKTGETISVNPRPMKSASIMKLFVMGAVYREIEQGRLSASEEITSMVKDMVCYSDNEYSNRLLYLIGGNDYAAGVERVNDFIRSCGFSSLTIEYNGFNSEDAILDRAHMNQVTAEDSGKLLEAIYRREWGSRKTSNEVEQMLLNQTNKSKIPAGLPDGVSCGNKTGEMDYTENDAAIIYGPNCDYVLVILSGNWESKDNAVERFRRISRLVYHYTNQ